MNCNYRFTFGLAFCIMLSLNIGLCQVTIKGQVVSGTTSIGYLKPFKGFANNFIETQLPLSDQKDFTLNFEIEKPTFIKFSIDGRSIILLCEPGETIVLKVSQSISDSDWLSITGRNSDANLYYNYVYNKNPIDKFLGVRGLFEAYHQKDVSIIFDRVLEEIQFQAKWVDSLLNEGRITKISSDYMKVQIRSQVAWEVGNLCYNYYDNNSRLIPKSSALMKKVFKEVNPLDPKLKSCLIAFSYYNNYYRELYKENKSIDSSMVISPEVPYYALAPLDIQDYLWGGAIYTGKLFMPYQFDYCLMFKKYKRIFKDGLFNEYYQHSDICYSIRKSEAVIVNSEDIDLFSTLRFHFQGKRLLVDLWATWCGPCKMEFKSYDSSLYRFLEKHKIQPVFVSIDKPNDKEKWRKEVDKLGLRGFHLLAGPKLQSSIRDVIFDSKSMVIPRYVLVSENGTILSADFMRPTNFLFRNEIAKYFPHEK